MARSRKQADDLEAARDAVAPAAATAGVRMPGPLELWPLDRLQPYERNPREHSADQVRRIAGSMVRFGFNAPILVDGRDGIVAGHGRLAAARFLNLERVPVVVLDHLSPTDRRKYLLADNRLAELSTWNELDLAAELADLGMAADELGDLGFRPVDLDRLSRSVTATTDVREVEPTPVPTAPVCRPGDLWIVGRHRVLCGDARRAADVRRALGGVLADAVVTDPPYGIEYVGKTGEALTIRNDGADDLRDLLEQAFRNALAACRPGAPWYVFAPTGDRLVDFLVTLTRLGVFRQTLVWVKDRMVLGRNDYHVRHEHLVFGVTPADVAPHDPERPYEPNHATIAYGWAPGGAHRPPHARTWDTVWEFARPSANREHPTMKPVELIGQAVDHATAPGRVVLDLFAGSGTTALVCEQLGRASASIEVDPRYCDVAVQRVAAAANTDPHLDGGLTWNEVAAERAAP